MVSGRGGRVLNETNVHGEEINQMGISVSYLLILSIRR